MTRSALQNKHIRPNTASWVVTMQHYFWFINWKNLKCKKILFPPSTLTNQSILSNKSFVTSTTFLGQRVSAEVICKLFMQQEMWSTRFALNREKRLTDSKD